MGDLWPMVLMMLVIVVVALGMYAVVLVLDVIAGAVYRWRSRRRRW